MELCPWVQGGCRLLGDPRRLDGRAYSALLRGAFRAVLQPHGSGADPELSDVDPAVLKQCHAAAAACILEAGRQRADPTALSACLEECKLDKERIEQFCTEYQKNRDALEELLGSIGRAPPHVTDVSWRLGYRIQTHELHRAYQPTYLLTLSTEVCAPHTPPKEELPFISFCNKAARFGFVSYRTAMRDHRQTSASAAPWSSCRIWSGS